MKLLKMNSKVKWIGSALVVLLVISLVGLVGCSQTTTSNPTVTPVTVANTVMAEGHLEPLTSTWLSFQTSGRVDEVLVQEGQSVKKDQPLVRLEGSDRAEAELTAAQSALYLAQQTLADAKKSDSLKAAAELKLAEAQRSYNTALGNYNDRGDTQGNDEQIALYEAKVTMTQDQVDKLQDRVDGMSEYADSDPAKAKVVADLNQAKLDLDNLKKLRDYYADLPDSLDVQTLTARLNVARATLQDAQRDYDRWKDGPSKEALAALQSQADSAQAAADEAQWAYDQLVLKSPYDGVFVQCDLTKGEFITAGMKAALVADFSSWLIETDDLDEIEVAQIDSSQPVTITADALPGEEFTGTVDRILDSYTDKNGDILYTAKIKLNSDEPKLRWGMTMQLEFQK